MNSYSSDSSMSGGTSPMIQTIINMFFKYKFIILAIVLFIILGCYYYFNMVNTKTAFNANREHGTNDLNSNI